MLQPPSFDKPPSPLRLCHSSCLFATASIAKPVANSPTAITSDNPHKFPDTSPRTPDGNGAMKGSVIKA